MPPLGCYGYGSFSSQTRNVSDPLPEVALRFSREPSITPTASHHPQESSDAFQQDLFDAVDAGEEFVDSGVSCRSLPVEFSAHSHPLYHNKELNPMSPASIMSNTSQQIRDIESAAAADSEACYEIPSRFRERSETAFSDPDSILKALNTGRVNANGKRHMSETDFDPGVSQPKRRRHTAEIFHVHSPRNVFRQEYSKPAGSADSSNISDFEDVTFSQQSKQFVSEQDSELHRFKNENSRLMAEIAALTRQMNDLQEENEVLKVRLAFPDDDIGLTAEKAHPMATLKLEAGTVVKELAESVSKIRCGMEKGFGEVLEGMAALKRVQERIESLGAVVGL
ncbi:hypothetical protein HDU83_004072 [Entophlyctis luteolus]|nr:hypothetical protein HDU83_004072 [Entophlyctis luteolus]KAJ3383816.1 hypothetical protein HDU84_003384 [Entophlyctis sp. JEL0112]